MLGTEILNALNLELWSGYHQVSRNSIPAMVGQGLDSLGGNVLVMKLNSLRMSKSLEGET